jgi:hypothetical protein
MDASSIVFLIVSCAVSFGLGRTFVHFRDKKQREAAHKREAQVLREKPVEPESKNKSKRKRQLQERNKTTKLE